jgi:hypothetical protein
VTPTDHPPVFCWDPDALAAFKSGLDDGLDPDDVGGKKGQSFGQGLHGIATEHLPTDQIKRSQVFDLAASAIIDTATVCAAALAWGGMNQRLSPGLFSMRGAGWLDVANRIRAGKLDRKAAYEAFAQLRHARKLFGLGPAYFTKIIYFLTPRTEAKSDQPYIMDQWAGCSINLLLSTELVKMNVTRLWKPGKDKPDFTYQVSEANTGADYDTFCTAVDALRAEFGRSPDEIDRAMIANGGRKKSSWRQYVISNRTI